MTFELPSLDFASDALEPVLSAETLALHHGKHHAAYVANLNDLVAGGPFADADLETILRKSTGALYNNAAQHFNHSLYWRCLTPGGSEPSPSFEKAVKDSFGSMDALREELGSTAKGVFGSGWGWLIKQDDGKLRITGSSNANVPLEGGLPVLTIDVWEHAYYVDYRNERPRYLREIWKIVDWAEVSRAFESDRLAVPAGA